MSTFIVDTESLKALQSTLLGVALEIEHGADQTAQYDEYRGAGRLNPWGQLNGADEVFTPFFRNWEYWLGGVANNIIAVARALQDAVWAYEQADDVIPHDVRRVQTNP
jgi:hypothetical protein